MSTTALNYPKIIPVRRGHGISAAIILILASLVLIVGARMIIVLSTVQDPSQADLIATAQHSIIPVPVPTPPTAVIQPTPSETPVPSLKVASGPYVVTVRVPIPPSR